MRLTPHMEAALRAMTRGDLAWSIDGWRAISGDDRWNSHTVNYLAGRGLLVKNASRASITPDGRRELAHAEVVALSQRSIIEINHDVPGQAKPGERARFYELFMRAIASGSDEAWAPLEQYGIRRVAQVHHSTDRKVVISGPGWEKEYQIP